MHNTYHVVVEVDGGEYDRVGWLGWVGLVTLVALVTKWDIWTFGHGLMPGKHI